MTDKYQQIAEAVDGLTEFQWDMIKGQIDFLFNQKASKLRLGSQEVERKLRQSVKIHQ